MQAHRYILSSIFDLKGHITSLKNIRGSITLKPFNIVKDIYILFSVLRSYSVSIYRFKRDNFLSENVICESKTCIQNGQYFERRLDLTSCECDVRRVERFLPPSLMKTQKIVEDNENSRGQKYTL